MRRALFIFVLSASAFATNYTVKTSGGSYTTLQACSNVAVAGDTCTVYAGSYAGWTQSTSGTSGNPITFTVNPGDTVDITSNVNISSGGAGTTIQYITIGAPDVGGGCIANATSGGAGGANPAFQMGGCFIFQNAGISGPSCGSGGHVNFFHLAYNTFRGNNPPFVINFQQSAVYTSAGSGGGTCTPYVDTTSSNNYIGHNNVNWNIDSPSAPFCNAQILMVGNYNLVEYNDMQGTGAQHYRIGGYFNLIRDDTGHDDNANVTLGCGQSPEHIDFAFQEGWDEPALSFSVTERSAFYNCTNDGGNCKFQFARAANATTFTVTFTNSSSSISLTNTGTYALTVGQPVQFTTTGALPSQVNVGQTYWVASETTSAATVSATLGGSAITFTTAGSSGTQTINAIASASGYNIVRYSYVQNIDGNLGGPGSNGDGSNTTPNWHLYNLTINAGTLQAGSGACGTFSTGVGAALNILCSNTENGSESPTVLLTSPFPSSGSACPDSAHSCSNGSIPYNTSGSGTWNGGCSSGVLWCTTQEQTFATLENQNPLFANFPTDGTLSSGSPALHGGVTYTTVSSGCGTTSLVVADAGFFFAGIGPTSNLPSYTSVPVGDVIRVDNSTYQLTAVNYATNTLTTSASVTCSTSDPVSLYQTTDGTVVFPTSQSVPNVGAFSAAASNPTTPAPALGMFAWDWGGDVSEFGR